MKRTPSWAISWKVSSFFTPVVDVTAIFSTDSVFCTRWYDFDRFLKCLISNSSGVTCELSKHIDWFLVPSSNAVVLKASYIIESW